MENTLPQNISDADIFHVTEAMIRYGGSFMSNLGRALRQADMENRRIIMANWDSEIQSEYDLYRSRFSSLS